ncbi:hypothetical protein [Arthrobacter sp. ISL-72]|uniref:hypothetical protein n=1 Tax=Arthrobacter sp. ISL-72 TaxID=2819114 RepID=UPI001BEA9E8F|nr:hypothetical protein [Arthrobacter sp. ISL-72]MBT2596875.1 hypothetical protein [Arthrobacter sp. ISL-72]
MTALQGWGRVAGPVFRRRPVVHSRIVAAVTVGSCLVHLGLAAGNHHGPWLNLLMLAMAGICLPCAVHIWRHGRERALRQVMACALVMTALHAILLLRGGAGLGGAALGGHGHHGTPVLSVLELPALELSVLELQGAGAASAEGMLAVVVLEITTAMLAATLLARLRRRATAEAVTA